MVLLDGKELATHKMQKIQEEVLKFKTKTNRVPTLSVVLVGNNPASQIYVGMKAKACKKAGIDSIVHEMSDDVSENILLEKIENMNNDHTIDGILVQLPLPKHLSQERVIEKISPIKDVDGFTTYHTGSLWSDINKDKVLVPATPLGVIRLLEHYKIDLFAKEVVVVGTSNIVGKPLCALFLNKGATVTMCNKNTKELSSHTKRADILCVGIGKANFIKKEMLKKGVVVVDIGTSKHQGKLTGDVDFKDVCEKSSYITPVPGGVGPMTIITLLENTLRAGLNNLSNSKLGQ